MRINIKNRQRRRFQERTLLSGIFVAVLLCLFVGAPEQVLAADTERTLGERITATIQEVFRQMDGVIGFSAQAIDAVFSNTVRVDQRQEPVGDTGITIPDPLPVTATRFPLAGAGVGTLIINAPLSITSSLQATGETTLASTSIEGLLTADDVTFDALTVTGLMDAGAIATNQLSVSGGTQLTSLDVSAAASVATLSVAGDATASNITVSETAFITSLLVQGATQLTGLLEADGGINTNGADVDLQGGAIFARNIVNEVIAGDGVVITGVTSTPTIAIDTDGIVTEINGETGEVEFREGDDINITSSLRIENTSNLNSVRNRGGCVGCITDTDVANSLTLTGGSIDAVVIGSSTAASAFFTETVVGTSTATTTTFEVLGSGTSNFGGSINLDSGCFSIGGVCVASAASSTSYVGLFDTPNTLISGAVQYANATGSALVQSADFVFDGSALAIGTSTPATTLTVAGDTTLVGELTVSSSTALDALTVSGGVNISNTLAVSDAVTFSDTLTVTGFTALQADLTVTGTTTVGGGISVAGSSDLGGPLTVDGDIAVENGASFVWYDADSSNYVGLVASTTLSGNTLWTLPTGDGFADQVLVTDGSGNLRFDSVSAIGGGATEYVGLNDTPASFASGTIPYANASGTALVHSTGLRYDGTNLSIGAVTPSAELTVDGSVDLIGGSGNVDFAFQDTTGYVGVGTENPAERLSLIGGSFQQRGGVSGDLYNPVQESLTALADDGRAIDIYGGYAYIGTETSGDDLQIFDIGNTAEPVEIGGIELGSRTNGLVAAGRYVYVASGFSGDNFHVLDVSNPVTPVEVASLDFSAAANGVALQNGYAYVVTDGSDSNFRVVDISNPNAVIQVASTSLPTNTKGVAVYGNYAFAVSEVAGDDFHAIDISDPLNPTVVDSINLSDTANGLALSPSGQYAYVGTNANGDDVEAIDISDPTALSLSNGIELGVSISSLYVAGDVLYASSFSIGQDFHVIDLRNPGNPVLIGGVDLGSGNALGVDVVGRFAYVVTAAGLVAVDVSGAQMQSVFTNSFEAGRVFVSGRSNFANNVAVQGELFAGEGIQGTGLLQINGSGSSYFAGSLSVGTTSSSTGLTVDGSMQATNLLGGAVNVTTDANGNIIRDPSDVRLKTNITTVDGALESLMELRGVRYQWKDTERFGAQTEIGFIAQEVDLVLPEVVRKGGDYWSINTRNILAVVVEAVKEVWTELQGTQEEVNDLRERVGQLESQLTTGTTTDTEAQSGGGSDDESNAATEETAETEVTAGNETEGQATESAADTETDLVGEEEATSTTTTSATTTIEADDVANGSDDGAATTTSEDKLENVTIETEATSTEETIEETVSEEASEVITPDHDNTVEIETESGAETETATEITGSSEDAEAEDSLMETEASTETETVAETTESADTAETETAQ